MNLPAKTSVLIVEDERIFALDLQQTLGELGYEPLAIASSSEQALARASERCPDVVLMDIRIKGTRDGIETAKLLKTRFDVPIVYLTAHADEPTLARARETEPLGYLLKPFKAAELRSAIEIAVHRHRVERRLRERERWFSTTLRSINDAVVTADMGSRITFLNRAAETLIGRSAEQAIGLPAREVLRLSNATSSETPIETALRLNQVVELHDALLINARTGAETLIDDSTARVVDEGHTLGGVMVFRDITERRRLQQQIELSDRLASLGTLAAGVAHEVNNPLSVINGNADLLGIELAKTASFLPVQQLQALLSMVQDISVAGDRIARIVADLAAFSRRRPTPATGVVDLRPSLEWAIRATAHELRQRAQLVTELGEVPLVNGDEARISQVLINLLMNASQAIAPGDAEHNLVTVVTRRDARGWAVLEVKDSGSGIPEETLKRVFEPFFTTKEVGQGTGLGLSICRGIVSSLGGQIEVESRVGEGTCVRVLLPPAASEPAEAPAAPTPTLSERRGTILVIDDEQLVLKVIARGLQDQQVTCTESAARALELLAAGERFDLILCDLTMPTMTGMAFYEQILRHFPELAERIVFLTGGAVTPEAAAFLEAVPHRQLHKPFSMNGLLELVQKALSALPPPTP